MRILQIVTAAVLAAGIGGLIVPALAQTSDGMGGGPDQGMGHMDRGMMSGGMMRGGMSGGMMGGGCSGMMRSMNGGAGRPNSQWHTHPPAGRSIPN